MAGDSALFRVTNPGDNEGNVGVTEKIEFNEGVVPDDTGKAVTSSWHALKDVSIHPNPNKSFNVVQDGRLGTIEVVIAGYFIEPASTSGPLLLLNFMTAAGTSNPNFRFGRFGVRIDDLSEIDLTPNATQGMILYDVFVERVQDSPNEIGFIAKLYRVVRN
jgi:hypothetical protein